jgi:hypothetical protein
LSRLGWPQEKISETVGINQQRISQITNNANFGNIGNLLAQGRDMEYIARLYNMDLALVWALRLEGKTDQEKFKELGWGLRTWDQWNFNECDERFGDDWPGRIPAQLIALSLMCACSLNENVNLLISQLGTIVLRYCAVTGTPGTGSGRSQKNRI